LIGDEVSRENFDAQERLRSFRSESFSSWGGGRHRSILSSSGSSVNVHFDSFFTNPFYSSGTQPFFFRREGFPDSKSIYIQTVEIPLEDLFSGVAEKKFTLKDSFVETYKAAFRDRIGQRVALQSFSNKCGFYFERKTSQYFPTSWRLIAYSNFCTYNKS